MTSAALAPALFAYRVRTIASFVLLDPVPAITGTRPPPASSTVSMTRSCSSKESGANLPEPLFPHPEVDDQLLPSPCADGHRRADETVNGGEDPAGHRARPASERFPLHPPLVGADPDRAAAPLAGN